MSSRVAAAALVPARADRLEDVRALRVASRSPIELVDITEPIHDLGPVISPVYLLNLAFAVVLSAAGDVWVPIGLALGATVLAAALAWRGSGARLRARVAV